MSKKKVTFTITGPGGSITGQELTSLMANAFGCNESGSIDERIIKDNLEIKSGEKLVYKLVIEKKYTQEQINSMPESDGDINYPP